MSERKSVRRKGGEEQRKKSNPTSPNPKRKASVRNEEETQKKRKKVTNDSRPKSQGNPKKPSENRRPSPRKEGEARVVREKEIRTGERKKTAPRQRPKSNQATSTDKNRRRTNKRPSAPPSKGKKILLLVWDVVFYGVLAILLLGVVMFNFNDNPNKALFGGYRLMTVLTNSMSPSENETEYHNGFKSGALVIVAKANPEELKEGDIITFNPVPGDTDTYLTHRVKKIMTELEGEEGLFFQTKGDANSGVDIPIRSTQVVGKVIFSIANVGNVMKFLRENLVIVGIFAVSTFTFFLVLKYYLNMEDSRAPASPRRKKKAGL